MIVLPFAALPYTSFLLLPIVYSCYRRIMEVYIGGRLFRNCFGPTNDRLRMDGR
jgi:hypothetical protein